MIQAFRSVKMQKLILKHFLKFYERMQILYVATLMPFSACM